MPSPICVSVVSRMPCKVWVYLTRTASPQKMSHGLLDAALRRWAGECGVAEDLSVVRPQYQKPYLAKLRDVDVSVSRSGTYWACAISAQKIGLDLQQENFAGTERITRRFLHPNERSFLEAYPEEFFKVWTAKESYVKLTGVGVTDQFGDFSVAENGKLKETLDGYQFRYLDAPQGYTMCLCGKETGEITVQWI